MTRSDVLDAGVNLDLEISDRDSNVLVTSLVDAVQFGLRII